MNRLPIRTRRTLQPDWSERETPYVHCPLSGTVKPLDACAGCGQSAGIEHDAQGHWFVVCRAAFEPPAVSWEKLAVGRAMTADPLCIHQDVDLTEVLALLVERGISGAPVVDDQGRPIGVVSQTDLLMEEYEQDDEDAPATGGGLRARDVMTRGVVSIRETAPLPEAIRLMSAQKIHRLPVVDGEGAVVGVLTTLDVIDALASKSQAN